MANKLTQLLGNSIRQIIIGVVHLRALPGTPLHSDSVKQITQIAVNEATIYANNGVDAILLENMHDIPYTLETSLDPVTTATMAVVAGEVRRHISDLLPIGIQILAGANQAALAVAKAADLDFIRAEGFIYGHVADEGWMNACAGTLLRYRRNIKADDILIICDIKKKHCAHAVTADVSLRETAAAVEFFRGDGLVVTGTATGVETNSRDVEEAVQGSKLPVFIGSGICPENVTKYPGAKGFIVGSWFKKDNIWSNELNPKRVEDFVKTVRSLHK